MKPTAVPKTDLRRRVAIACFAGIAGAIAIAAMFVDAWLPTAQVEAVAFGLVSHRLQPAVTSAASGRHAVHFGAPRVVDQVKVAVGSTVRAGDVIATLEPIDGTELGGLEAAVERAERSLCAMQETPPVLVVPVQERVVQAAERAVARSAKEIEDARRTLERAKDAVDDTYRRLIDEELGWA